jgi:hypothetical protein
VKILVAAPAGALREACAYLRDLGHDPVSLGDVLLAEAVVLVHGWENSRPALIRAATAEGLGLAAMTLEDFD